jgi:NADH dehydrogenase
MKLPMAKTRIVIVGGGFGGVNCAKTLSRGLDPDDAEVVLFNRENHLVFSPLLTEVVGSSINPLDVVVPLRHLLPHAFCRTEEVRNIDLDGSEIEYESEDCSNGRMSYDHLVLACGNTANLHLVPGMADHAFPLKNVGDAFALRSHILRELERAEVCCDAQRRRWHLSFIVVGGGYTGVEVAGEINELVRSSARYFQNFTAQDITVTLIHSRGQVLPEVSSALREFAREKLKQAGVNLVLGCCAVRANAEGVTVESRRLIRGGTIVCTIGTAPVRLVECLDAEKKWDRLVTDPDLRISGRHNAWAVGDCAFILNDLDFKPARTTGQFAEREGKQCAYNIMRVLKGYCTEPFSYRPLGELCSIGGHSAVAEIFDLRLAGFLAWFVWRGVYLFKLPSWLRRIQVGFDWALLFLFPRDLSHLRSRPTDRVSRAHYQPGDLIFRQGDPALVLYVIEVGGVELFRMPAYDSGPATAEILGPGSLFGESALLDEKPRSCSARALTRVDVLIMTASVFRQISESSRLRNALAQALNRQSNNRRGDSGSCTSEVSLSEQNEHVEKEMAEQDSK